MSDHEVAIANARAALYAANYYDEEPMQRRQLDATIGAGYAILAVSDSLERILRFIEEGKPLYAFTQEVR